LAKVGLRTYKTQQLKDGRWLARFSLGGQVHGSTARSEAEAEARRDDLIRKMMAGHSIQALPVRNTRTVSWLCNLFLHAISAEPGPGVQRFGETPLKPGSVGAYVSILRRHCDARPYPMGGGSATEAGRRFGALPVAEVKPRDVQRLLDDMKANGYAVGTRSKLYTTLKQVFRYGIQIEWIKATDDGYRTAVEAVSPPKGSGTPRAFLTAPEARVLLDTAAASGNRWADAVEILVRTGLRRSELLGLTWSTVQLDEDGSGGWLTVSAGLQRQAERLGRPSKLVLGTVKSTSSRRPVRLTVESVQALVRQCERQQREQGAAGERWTGRDAGTDEMPIFATRFGGWSETTVFNEGFRAIADAAGFPKLTIHGCRHTFVSILADQMLRETGTINWEQLAYMAGHSDSRVTRRVYAHLDQAAVDVVRREAWTQAGSVRV
jgi:integrase